ncbi:hypothetical protein PJP10_31770, partial [Mycobacterium kansasii]
TQTNFANSFRKWLQKFFFKAIKQLHFETFWSLPVGQNSIAIHLQISRKEHFNGNWKKPRLLYIEEVKVRNLQTWPAL